MIKIKKNILGIIVNVLTIVIFVVYFYKNPIDTNKLKEIGFQLLLIISLIEILFTLINSYINYNILKNMNKKTSFLDMFLLQFTNNFFNKIFPKMGAGYRAYYLKKEYSISYSEFASTIAGLYVISFLTYGLIGLLSSIIIYYKYGIINNLIVIGFLGITIFNIFLILKNPKINNPKNKIIHTISRVLSGWNLIKENKKFVILLIFFTFLMIVLSSLQLKFVLKEFNVILDFIKLLFLSSISLFTSMANITPDGLGINEAIYAYSNRVVSVDANTLIAASLVLRAIKFFTSLVLGGSSFLILKVKK